MSASVSPETKLVAPLLYTFAPCLARSLPPYRGRLRPSPPPFGPTSTLKKTKQKVPPLPNKHPREQLHNPWPFAPRWTKLRAIPTKPRRPTPHQASGIPSHQKPRHGVHRVDRVHRVRVAIRREEAQPVRHVAVATARAVPRQGEVEIL